MDRTKKAGSKISVWRLDAPGGKARYERLTDQFADLAVQIILESPNSNIMLERLNNLIRKIKMEAFGMRTISHKRFAKECDERLATKRLCELERAKEELDQQTRKISEQVFLVRKSENREQETFMEALNHYKTGERLEDPDKIRQSVLDYNIEVLELYRMVGATVFRNL